MIPLSFFLILLLFNIIFFLCRCKQVTEYKSAEWSDNQDLQRVSHDEVQTDGLDPDKYQA